MRTVAIDAMAPTERRVFVRALATAALGRVLRDFDREQGRQDGHDDRQEKKRSGAAAAHAEDAGRSG